jgi:benzylsuccinate CoA-transferase BbsE subunit
LVSITPFGQAGPYKDYKAPDIVAWAMGGNMLARDDPDRPPVRVSHHSQAYLNAASDAVDGTMMALYHRQMTGEGQQVDVSIQESVIQATWTVTDRWDMLKDAGLHGELDFYSIRVPRVWPCKDGYIQWTYGSGAWAKQHNQAIIEWMDSEGMADDFLKKFDWDTFDLRTASQEVIDHQVESTIKFFMTHTKAELLEGAVKYRIRLYPFATTADTLENVQLNEREFWVEVEYPELGTTIIHPGAFAKASEAPLRISCRAPLIGEHNKEIYEKELGISIEELLTLKQARII